MCAHNEQTYIESSVKSVLQETEINLELVVVDDRSVDDTADILRKIAKDDKRLKIITRVDNVNDECLEDNVLFAVDHGYGGQTDALNLGLKYCEGEFIARLDADDISLPGRFVTQLNFMKKNKFIDFLGSSAHRLDNDGRVFGKYHSAALFHDEIVEKLYSFKAYCPHSSWFVRSDLYRTLNGYNENGFRAEDLDFMLRASELPKMKFGFLNEPLICLRMQDGRLSTGTILPAEHAIFAVVCSLLRVNGYSVEKSLISDIRDMVEKEVLSLKLLKKFQAYRFLSDAYIAIKKGNFIGAFTSIFLSIKSYPVIIVDYGALSKSKLAATKAVYEKVISKIG